MKTKKIMELVMLCISFAFFAISCQQDDNLSEITDNKATVSGPHERNRYLYGQCADARYLYP